MSIGPSSKAQKEASITGVRAIAGSMLNTARKNPAEALFFFGLALLLIGLPAGIVFPVQYYAVIAILGGLTVASHLEKEQGAKKKSHDK